MMKQRWMHLLYAVLGLNLFVLCLYMLFGGLYTCSQFWGDYIIYEWFYFQYGLLSAIAGGMGILGFIFNLSGKYYIRVGIVASLTRLMSFIELIWTYLFYGHVEGVLGAFSTVPRILLIFVLGVCWKRRRQRLEEENATWKLFPFVLEFTYLFRRPKQ